MTDQPGQSGTERPVPPHAEPAADPQASVVEPPPRDPTIATPLLPDPTVAAPPVRLWFPRDMAITSALLGFPGGFGLAARNAWRLGRRATAYLLLLAGAAILLLFFFALPDDLPTGIIIGLNVGIVVGLFALMRSQIQGVERAGGTVERAPGPAGLATYLGGWIATAAPSFVLLVALTFLGSQVQAILAGTVAFGAAGVACDVESSGTSFAADQPVHYVAYLSREVKAGETIQMSLRQVSGTVLHKDDLTVDAVADCVSGTVPSSTLSSGTYVFEFTIGAERLASGEVLISAP